MDKREKFNYWYFSIPIIVVVIIVCIWDWLFPGPLEDDFVDLWNIAIECDQNNMPHHALVHNNVTGISHGAVSGWYAIYPKAGGKYGMMVSQEFADWNNLPSLDAWNEIILTYVPGSGSRSDRPTGAFDCLQGVSTDADKMTGNVVLHNDAGGAVDHIVQIWMWERSSAHGKRRAPLIEIDHAIGSRHRGVIH